MLAPDPIITKTLGDKLPLDIITLITNYGKVVLFPASIKHLLYQGYYMKICGTRDGFVALGEDDCLYGLSPSGCMTKHVIVPSPLSFCRNLFVNEYGFLMIYDGIPKPIFVPRVGPISQELENHHRSQFRYLLPALIGDQGRICLKDGRGDVLGSWQMPAIPDLDAWAGNENVLWDYCNQGSTLGYLSTKR